MAGFDLPGLQLDHANIMNVHWQGQGSAGSAQVCLRKEIPDVHDLVFPVPKSWPVHSNIGDWVLRPPSMPTSTSDIVLNKDQKVSTKASITTTNLLPFVNLNGCTWRDLVQACGKGF